MRSFMITQGDVPRMWYTHPRVMLRPSRSAGCKTKRAYAYGHPGTWSFHAVQPGRCVYGHLPAGCKTAEDGYRCFILGDNEVQPRGPVAASNLGRLSANQHCTSKQDHPGQQGPKKFLYQILQGRSPHSHRSTTDNWHLSLQTGQAFSLSARLQVMAVACARHRQQASSILNGIRNLGGQKKPRLSSDCWRLCVADCSRQAERTSSLVTVPFPLSDWQPSVGHHHASLHCEWVSKFAGQRFPGPHKAVLYYIGDSCTLFPTGF
jgi:hypothetical protein